MRYILMAGAEGCGPTARDAYCVELAEALCRAQDQLVEKKELAERDTE